MQEDIRKTPLYSIHLSLGAKIVDFHGWLMPVEYKSILAEAIAVRKSCGVFDASHMGEIEISGSQAQQFVQYVLTNDVSLLPEGSMQYNLICAEDGGILDDLMVYRKKSSFSLVVNASNTAQDYNWLRNHSRSFDVEIKDVSSEYALIAVQGPMAESVLRENLKVSLNGLNYMHFIQINSNFGSFLISRSGYTGEDGFEIFVAGDLAGMVWEKIFSKAEEFGIFACGLGARDILRLEMGYPLCGNDIGRDINPVEAGLLWAVKLDKGDFVGKSIIEGIKSRGPEKQRIGFVMQDKGVARQNYGIFSSEHKHLGKVTSGGYSPNLDKFIGMGYVDKSFLAAGGREIFIDIRGKMRKAAVAKIPFIAAKTKP